MRYINFLLVLQISRPKRLYRKQNIQYLQNSLLANQCADHILEPLFYLD
jgi:hypothetical protein